MKMSAIVLGAAGLLLLPVAGVSAEEVNDAQIASIVVTANQVDIDAGQLAASRATNDEIRTFARLMVTDHTGVNKAATDLVAKLKTFRFEDERRLRTVADYAQSKDCRSVLLRRYFGEEHPPRCGTCDRCRADRAAVTLAGPSRAGHSRRARRTHDRPTRPAYARS